MSIQFGNGLIIDEDNVALKNDTSNIFNIGISTSPNGLLNISRDNDSLLSFDPDSIIIHKNFKRVNTDSETVLLEGSDSNNGSLYVGGYVGIGTSSYESTDSLYTLSNIRTNKDVVCKNIEASESVKANFIRRLSSSQGAAVSDGKYSSGNEIQLKIIGNDENIVLLADTITLLGNTINLNADSTIISNLEITTRTFANVILNNSTASNLIVINAPSVEGEDIPTSSSLLIQHAVVSDNDAFTPLMIKSQIKSSTTTYNEVLKISKEGHMLVGVDMQTSNIDHIIRGRVLSTYDSNYSGLLHLSTYNAVNETETEQFIIDKTGNTYIAGNVGIGTTISSHSLDVLGSAVISGNVGIGTDTPIATLDVRGTLNIGDDATFYSNISADSLSVTNSSVLTGTLSVSDNSTFSKDITIGSNIIISGNVGIGISDTSYGFTVCKNAVIGEGIKTINNTNNGGPYFKQGVFNSVNYSNNIITITPEEYGNTNALHCAGTMHIQVIINGTNQIANVTITFIYETSSGGISQNVSIPRKLTDIPGNWPQGSASSININSSDRNINIGMQQGTQFKIFWTVIGGIIYDPPV